MSQSKDNEQSFVINVNDPLKGIDKCVPIERWNTDYQRYTWVTPRRVVESIDLYNKQNQTRKTFNDWAHEYVKMVKTSADHIAICEKFGIIELMIIRKNKVPNDVCVIMIQDEDFDITKTGHEEYKIVDNDFNSDEEFPAINSKSLKIGGGAAGGGISWSKMMTNSSNESSDSSSCSSENSKDRSIDEIDMNQLLSKTPQRKPPQTPPQTPVSAISALTDGEADEEADSQISNAMQLTGDAEVHASTLNKLLQFINDKKSNMSLLQYVLDESDFDIKALRKLIDKLDPQVHDPQVHDPKVHDRQVYQQQQYQQQQYQWQQHQQQPQIQYCGTCGVALLVNCDMVLYCTHCNVVNDDAA